MAKVCSYNKNKKAKAISKVNLPHFYVLLCLFLSTVVKAQKITIVNTLTDPYHKMIIAGKQYAAGKNL